MTATCKKQLKAEQASSDRLATAIGMVLGGRVEVRS
jgi:hypothetical protein